MLGFYPLSGAPISGLSPSQAFVSFVSPWRRVLQMQAIAVDDEESSGIRRPQRRFAIVITYRQIFLGSGPI